MKKLYIVLLMIFTIFIICGCSKDKLAINGENSVEVGCTVLLNTNYKGEENITWFSENENIATVTDGLVKGISVGAVTITASVGDLIASKEITVTPEIIEITINGVNSLFAGEERQFTVSFSKETTEKVTWSSSNEEILIVDQEGKVRGVKPGEANIIASLNGSESRYSVTVLDSSIIHITGKNVVVIDNSINLICNYDCNWFSTDESIAIVLDDGEVIGVSIGKTTIVAVDKNDENNKAVFEIEVTPKIPLTLSISGKNKVAIEKSIELQVISYPQDTSNAVTFKSSDESIAVVSNEGIVTGVNEGQVVITVVSIYNENVTSSITIEVVAGSPKEIIVSGKNTIIQGEYIVLGLEIIGDKVTKEVVWKTSDPTIAIVSDAIVLAVNKGSVTISAHSIIDEEVYGSIEIKVEPYVSNEYSKEDIETVNKMIEKMSLKQKVGQMFIVGFSGTSFNSNFENVIKEYNFGNVIYMGNNVTDYKTLGKLSNDIQNAMIKYNTVPGFISIDQEGGRVARLINGGTHFISNMAMAATGNIENTYLEGLAVGDELRHYGINVDFAPVLDVNNNPNNPVIGIRSYSDNPLYVALYGNKMIDGLRDGNVMGCSKHFPGHGNTSVDSHYGLPTITTNKNELYQTELAPFISAISNGIDSIMTTHIIFTAIDDKYPATLSSKVLTGLLREELGFDGLIITDGMEMNAVSKYFGDYDKTGVLAVKAGVDILTYTSNDNPRKALQAIINAVNNGEITEERINESVRRILLKKLKYNIIDNYQSSNESYKDLAKNEQLCNKFAMESVTLVKGSFSGLDMNKSTLIISPETSFSLGSGLSSNSFANYACNYLKSKGHNSVDFETVGNNISNDDSQTILEKAKNFDQIVVAMSNVKTSNYTRTINFVNKLAKMDKEVIVIALDTPYDLMSYSSDVKTYICVYGYQRASTYALSKYLNGEFEATGKIAVDKNIFE